jgi:DNA-binding transcriptional LysR family regulator
MTEPSVFELAYVPGVTPGKWVQIWDERRPDVPLRLVPTPADAATGLLRCGDVAAALLRLPIDREGLSVITLYTETTVVVVPRDHLLGAAEDLTVADLVDETVLQPNDDWLDWDSRPGSPAAHRPDTTGAAIELVAAGIGIVVVPLSLARLHHRRDLIYRPVLDAPISQVALAWPTDATTDLVEEFVGIVRGRTANSSRGRQPPKRSAKDKAAAKRAARAKARAPQRRRH